MFSLKGKRILVTGATGLIGGAVTKYLSGAGASVIALVRDAERAKKTLGGYCSDYIVGDVRTIDVCQSVDGIVHAAATTGSRAFVETPVEVISDALSGAVNMLELAKKSGASIVFTSSMEVYGAPPGGRITEKSPCYLDTMSARSSYPEAKRAVEALAAAYAAEYGVRAMSVRLTQTFGPGVRYDDGRVFAEFSRCAIEGRDIVLKTKGETERSYLFTEDAASAIAAVLQKGGAGEAYNAANEETYCSIMEMAELVANSICGGRIKVVVDESGAEKRGYAPTLRMDLDTGKLRALGWAPTVGLEQMFRLTIKYMTEEKSKR